MFIFDAFVLFVCEYTILITKTWRCGLHAWCLDFEVDPYKCGVVLEMFTLRFKKGIYRLNTILKTLPWFITRSSQHTLPFYKWLRKETHFDLDFGVWGHIFSAKTNHLWTIVCILVSMDQSHQCRIHYGDNLRVKVDFLSINYWDGRFI